MIFSGPYQGDSDADDEYERSVMISPHLADDSETSPTDSEAPSTENTPTTHGNTGEERKSPKPIITEWTVDECVKFSASLGLLQYCETFRGESQHTNRKQIHPSGGYVADRLHLSPL